MQGSDVLIVQALIACGAKIGVQNNSKETPLSAAKQSRNQEIKDYLIGISTKKIQRSSLDELIKKYLPILNGEEEEDEEKDDEDQDHISITDSNSTEINEFSKNLGKGAKQVSSIYQSLKEIENRINTITNTIQIIDLNSKKYPDRTAINLSNEEDSHLNNLSKYINDLSGKINYIEHTLSINQNHEEEYKEEDDKKQKNKKESDQEQSRIEPKAKKAKKRDGDYDDEPLQNEIKSSFPFFKSKNKCNYCGNQRCHLCSNCRNFICPICTKSILHINDDKK